jgi:hypothetical protein
MRGDAGVAGDQGNRLDARLGDEKAVEGVAVWLPAPLDIGKAAVRGSVSRRDRQQREALGEQLLSPLLGGLDLAKGRLDRRLEQRAGAEQRFL